MKGTNELRVSWLFFLSFILLLQMIIAHACTCSHVILTSHSQSLSITFNHFQRELNGKTGARAFHAFGSSKPTTAMTITHLILTCLPHVSFSITIPFSAN
jgi:hypothetical protein